MLENKNILADMHTHTHFSLHAYSTVQENIVEALKKKMKYLAITDHYYGNIDDLSRKNEINRILYMRKRVNSYEDGIEILGSAEFNINQAVYQFEKIKVIPWRPVGLHNWFLDTSNITLEDLKSLFFRSATDYNVFNHIEREIHKVNNGMYRDELSTNVKQFFEEIVLFAKNNNIYLEVNESSLITDECGTVKRLRYWLNLARENGNKICLGTDSHYCKEVGVFDHVLNLLNEFDYPKYLILNCNKEELDKIFIDY